MAIHHAANVGEITPGKPKIIEVNNKQIGIFYEDGAYYAVLNVCPHAYAPICLGRVETPVMAEATGTDPVTHYRIDTSRKMLRCPWHHWEFELDTGKAACNVKQRLKMYPVHVDGERICIEV